jgi:uncharacterized protein DUF955
VGLVRGFKTFAKKLAAETRAELGLSPAAPLDHLVLANFLGIPVIPMSDYLGECPHLDYLTSLGKSQFSAITLFDDVWRMIIHNDAHAPCRQKSNIVHEIAHALLQHPPAQPLNEKGERNYDSGIEGEAHWLAGELLVTDAAAIHVVKTKLSDAAAAARYGICPQMLKYRLAVTGAHNRAARLGK